MKLSGKETTMRRGACLLALMGITVQSALGDEFFSAGTAPTPPAKPAAATSSATGNSNSISPQRFTRSAASKPSDDTLRSYYKELFGTNPPGESAAQQPVSSGRTKLTAEPASATIAEHESPVVHAEFQPESTESSSQIQQVRAERFSARPFPGAGLQPSAPASQAPATAAGPAMKPSTSRGSVTFSRSTPGFTARSGATIAQKVDHDSVTSTITAAPAVTVEWRKHSDMNVGQECRCHLIVKNVGQSEARDLEVQAHFPETVRLIDAKPAPSLSDRYLGWKMPELKAGEERTIEITMIPLQRGDINTRAEVRFSGTANGKFAVSEPLLDIELEGPTQVLLGESAAQVVTVSNPGTGIANHVQIEALLPEGLEHIRGQRLKMDLGNLNPGESRSVRLALAAAKGGEQHLVVQARAESGLLRSATADVTVIAPSLTTNIEGPGLRYLGRQASYTMHVVNDGEAATDNVQLRYKVPSGFDFVSADRGAQFDPATGLVTWFVGRLKQGESTQIKVTLLARQSGEFKHLARATSEHGAISDAELLTTIEGTPSLSIQVKDLEDPVEVGTEMTYEVSVRNEGSAAAKAVGLVCELPEGMTLVHAVGPVQYVVENNQIIFQGLPEVAPGQTVSFKVQVKAAVADSLRFRAHLSSESIDEPLTAEELTKFYGE